MTEPSAANHITKGEELLDRGDFNGARLEFETAAALDPSCGEALLGLGEVDLMMGDVAASHKNLKKALDIEKKKLGGTALGARNWWNDPETKTFMKAKEAIGIVYWDEGKYDKALTEFRDILRRDPDDHQNVRPRIPSLLMLKDSIDEAIAEFTAIKASPRNGVDDPHLLYNWALALFAAKDISASTAVLHRAVFSNIYVPALILMCPAPAADIYIHSSYATPEHALSYFSGYNHLWQRQEGSISFLEKMWNAPEIRRGVTQYIQVMNDVVSAEPVRRKKHLTMVASRLRLKPVDEQTAATMEKAWEAGEFTGEADRNLLNQREDEIMNMPVCPLDGGGIPCAPAKFLDALYGLLYYEGALEIRDVFEYLCEGIGLTPGLSVRELYEHIEKDTRFRLDIPDAVFREEVEEPERCLQMKEIYRPADVPDYNLEDLERAALNAVSPTEEEKTLILAMRNISRPMSLDEIRVHIRNCDITRVQKRLGIDSLPKATRRVLEMLVKKVWMTTPRYELWGFTPFDMVIENVEKEKNGDK